MIRNTLIPCFILFLFINGCAPNATIYYHPTAEGGYVHADHCMQTESLIDFEIVNNYNKIKIRAWAEDGENINQVYILFFGNSWSNVKFTSIKVILFDLENNIEIDPLSIFANNDSGFAELNTNLYTAPKKPLEQMTRFSVQIRLPDPMPKVFDLSIPPIMIDGNKIELPTILFKRKVWIGISPFNC